MAICARVGTKFEQRRQRGLEFSESLKSHLEKHPRCLYVEELGYETKFSRRAVVDLSRTNTKTAQFLRFIPDLLLRTPQDFYFVEVKNGLRIERTAWDWYFTYSWTCGTNVVFYFQHLGHWYWSRFEDIRFVDSHKEVEKFGSKAFRIVDGDWIRPGFRQAQLKKSNMSGCDYKVVSLDCLRRVGA